MGSRRNGNKPFREQERLFYYQTAFHAFKLGIETVNAVFSAYINTTYKRLDTKPNDTTIYVRPRIRICSVIMQIPMTFKPGSEP